jgi:hypothetical protein
MQDVEKTDNVASGFRPRLAFELQEDAADTLGLHWKSSCMVHDVTPVRHVGVENVASVGDVEVHAVDNCPLVGRNVRHFVGSEVVDAALAVANLRCASGSSQKQGSEGYFLSNFLLCYVNPEPNFCSNTCTVITETAVLLLRVSTNFSLVFSKG